MKREQLADHDSRKPLHHLAERLALKRTIRNLAFVVGAVGQYPCFTDRSIARKRRREQVGQATATPQAVLIDRFEPQRVQPCFIHRAQSFTIETRKFEKVLLRAIRCTQPSTSALIRQPRLAQFAAGAGIADCRWPFGTQARSPLST